LRDKGPRPRTPVLGNTVLIAFHVIAGVAAVIWILAYYGPATGVLLRLSLVTTVAASLLIGLCIRDGRRNGDPERRD